jgi:hypothetical protein
MDYFSMVGFENNDLNSKLSVLELASNILTSM